MAHRAYPFFQRLRHADVKRSGPILLAFAVGVVVGSVFVGALLRPSRGVPDGPGRAETAMDQLLPEVELDHVPLEQAVEKLSRLSGVRVVAEWKLIEAAGLSRDEPVTFRARNVTLDQVIAALCESNKNRWQRVGYFFAGDEVVITAGRDLLARATRFGTYDVSDLMPRPDGGTPYAVLMMNGGTGYGPADALLLQCTTADKAQEPALFARYFAGKLLIRQTWEGHRTTARVLAQLRDGRPAAAPPPGSRPEVWDPTAGAYAAGSWREGENALRRRAPEVRLQAVPLDQALDTLRQLYHATIVIDWSVGGSAYNSPVTVVQKDATLAAVLRPVLDAAKLNHFTFGARGGVVWVVPPAHRDFVADTRVYPVADLFPGAAGKGPPPDDPAATAEALRIARLIRANVAPDSWMEDDDSAQHGAFASGNRAGFGRMEVWQGKLLVRQTWENHERLADFLAWLRARPDRVPEVLKAGAAPPRLPTDGGRPGGEPEKRFPEQ